MKDYLRRETKAEKTKDGYELDTHKGWMGAISLFGGYINAIVMQALTEEVNDPERLPRSFNINFLRPYPVGRLRVVPHIERSGSSVTVLSFRVFTDDVLCGVGNATFGKDRKAGEYVHAQPPEVSAFDPDAKKATELDSLICMENFEIWVEDRQAATERSEIVAWARSSKGDVPDNLFYVAISDAIPPVVFARQGLESHFAGTMDFTAHFRRPELKLKPKEAILGRLYTSAARSGYVDEDCTLFTAGGELLYQSRQMRFIQKVDSFKPASGKISDR